ACGQSRGQHTRWTRLSGLPGGERLKTPAVLGASGLTRGKPDALSLLLQTLKPGLARLVPLNGGLAIPPGRLAKVLFHTAALLVHPAQVALRPRIALLGGLAVPPGRQGEVRIHTHALFVQPPEVILRPRIALFGGLAIPPSRLLVVPLHPP